MIEHLRGSEWVGSCQSKPGLNGMRGGILAESQHANAIELPFAVLKQASRARSGNGAIRRRDHLDPIEIDENSGSCNLKMDSMRRPAQERDGGGRADLRQPTIILEELDRLRIACRLVIAH